MKILCRAIKRQGIGTIWLIEDSARRQPSTTLERKIQEACLINIPVSYEMDSILTILILILILIIH